MFRVPRSKIESGSTMVEFIAVAPVILFMGLGSLQTGLIYHAKSTLNYATFEAARAGAVNHAQLDKMKGELGYRLAPLYGGDGSAKKAGEAIALSMANVNMPLQTEIEILSPTLEAFNDWGEISYVSGARAIPNSHLRSRHDERLKIGQQSGLNLHDANLLKIKVTHGLKLQVPLVSSAITQALLLIDPSNAHYYARNQLPITSVATVRMQSEAWETPAVKSASAVPGASSAQNTNQVVANTHNSSPSTPCADVYGLTSHDALMSSVQNASNYGGTSGVCGVTTNFSNQPLNAAPKQSASSSGGLNPPAKAGPTKDAGDHCA